MALSKVNGVDAVDVTLKRGVAHIRLREGNTVTLAQLRGVIKDAGYTSRDAVVTVIGQLGARGQSPVLSVAGTDERFLLEPDPKAPRILEAWTGKTSAAVEAVGTVPEQKGTGMPVLRVRTVTAR